MSHVAFTPLPWGSGWVGQSMQQGLTSPSQPCLRSGSTGGEVAWAGKMLSGSVKPFCAVSPKGRAVSVLTGAQHHFVVVCQWGWASSTYREQFICVVAAHKALRCSSLLLQLPYGILWMQRKLFSSLFQQTISLLLPNAFFLACLGAGRRGNTRS